MTVIRATCVLCNHDVEITHEQMTLVDHHYKNSTDPGRLITTYQFECPECGDFSIKQADEHTSGVLIGGGVEYRVVNVNKEIVDVTDPITDNEVIDFVVDLRKEITPDDLTAI